MVVGVRVGGLVMAALLITEAGGGRDGSEKEQMEVGMENVVGVDTTTTSSTHHCYW